MRDYVVYILRCADGSLYVGLTGDLENRLRQHADGVFAGAYTSTRRPVTLVYVARFADVFEAISWERRIKRWTRAKKEALIRGEWGEVQKLAACANESHHRNVFIDRVSDAARTKLLRITLQKAPSMSP